METLGLFCKTLVISAKEMTISSFGCKPSAAKSLARLAFCCVLCALLVWNEAAAAQTYPSKPVHIVVPFAPGGITDILARALAQRLTESMRQQVLVEDRPGATGQVGAEAVAKAAPDGYTLLVAADATFVTNPHFYNKLANDALSDFAPITGLGISPQALIVNPALPVRTLGDLIELARRKPGEINYGTFGIGSSGHLNIILLGEMTGTKFTPVHYRGAAPAITDVIGGHIQMMIVSIGLIAQPWQSGQLRVLGFGSTARLPQYPGVPTLAESGLPGYEAGSWYGLAAPKGTPAEIVNLINAQTRRIFDDPAFRDQFLAPNFIFSIVSAPQAFGERVRAESAKWGKVIRDAGVKME
jgi:tripartite-type tricarboxylate transporter receptor subunit TctC